MNNLCLPGYLSGKTSLARLKRALPLHAVLLLLPLFRISAQEIRVAYFGETLTHYGVRGGVSYPLRQNGSRRADDRPKIANNFYFGLTLTAFRHPHNHIGIILAPELGWRRTGRRGGFVQAAISSGLFRSFYEGRTWRSTENGRLKRVPLAGQWGFLPGVSLGFGHRIGKAEDAPYSWFCNVHYMRQYPYNHSFMHRMALEAGIIKKMH